MVTLVLSARACARVLICLGQRGEPLVVYNGDLSETRLWTLRDLMRSGKNAYGCTLRFARNGVSTNWTGKPLDETYGREEALLFRAVFRALITVPGLARGERAAFRRRLYDLDEFLGTSIVERIGTLA